MLPLIFFLLSFLCTIFFIVALFIRHTLDVKGYSLKKVLLGITGAFFVSFVLFVATVPQVPQQSVKAAATHVTVIPTKKLLPTLTPIPTPTVVPTRVPTKTPVIPTETPVPQTQTAPANSDQSTQTQQDTGLSNNNSYTNIVGNQVHSPAYSSNGQVPAGATAQCNDGTYSFSQHHSGTCSGHGGVAQWL